MVAESVKYRIGIDVGDRSVGLAAFEFDDDGFPLRKLAMVTYRHDGGLDPTQNKSPKSRKETAGVARRVRRMRRRRKQRLKALDDKLLTLGYPVPSVEEPQTYEAWKSRALLTTEKIEDKEALAEHLVRGLRHMARHRGWRNPWWQFSQLDAAPVPSETMVENLAHARLLWPSQIDDETTPGELGALASTKDVLLRPRTNKRENGLHKQSGVKAILDSKVRQEDLLAEVKKMWRVQELPKEQYSELVHALFDQTRPYVPANNVGRDPLPGRKSLPRAPRSSLEFTEFRIRQAVANLRVRGEGGSVGLTSGQYIAAVNYLMNYAESDPPTWGDVADQIGVEATRLIAPVIDDVRLSRAPCNRSTYIFTKALPKSSEAMKWWSVADVSLRSLLIMFLSDPTIEATETADACGLSATFESWPEKEREKLEGLDFESGRAAYSVRSLIDLNEYMKEYQADLHTARKAVFGVDDSWQPPRENLHEPTGQPAVDRVLTIVRRFTMACERKWGRPDRIVIEHVRTGLMGPTQRSEVLREMQRNRNENERIKGELRVGGIDSPTRVDVRRNRIVQNQGCKCLYCGAMITVKTAELDHIVPRAGGGSSRVDNIVAVCRGCNADKGRIPFAVWAAQTNRANVSLDDALGRLWEFDKVGVYKGVAGKRLKAQIARRLRQTEEDEPIDERSLESTAYSAVSIRHRLETYFNTSRGITRDDDEFTFVDVYSGSLTRESRRAGGIDGQILLRGQPDKNRFDVRHHAIDAAVMTLLNPSVARTLAQRQLLHTQARLESRDTGWKEFTGLESKSRERLAHWKKQCVVLADLICEAITEDSIPVINPLRLTPKNGSVHKDTLAALQSKLLGEAWMVDEISRVVDPNIYLELNQLLGKAKALDEDAHRSFVVAGRHLVTGSEVKLFPEKAASIVAATGSVKIGDSLHHARLYAWPTKKGYEVGMLRVFGAEFPWLFKEYGTTDALTVPIHPGSQSYRDMKDTLRKKIESGDAKEIGWITQGDEIEIQLDSYAQEKDDLGRFINLIPEARWRVDGFYDNRRLRLRPILLSYEEIPGDYSPSVIGDEASQLIQKVLEKGAIVTAGKVLGAEGSKILRRNHLGAPVWKSRGQQLKSIDIKRSITDKLGA